MDAHIDHIVLWVDDVRRSIDFYDRVLGLPGVRVDEFYAGEAPFPSMRLSAESIIDLMPSDAKIGTEALTKAENTAGYPVNHFCLAMSEAEYGALVTRLKEQGINTSRNENSFGARGIAPRTFYFQDPDRNVIEARYYDTVSVTEGHKNGADR